jgi:hypothetical protein
MAFPEIWKLFIEGKSGMKKRFFLWALLLGAWISTPLGVHAYDFVGTGFSAQDTPATLNPLIEEYNADHAPLQLITDPFDAELFPDSESQSGIIAWDDEYDCVSLKYGTQFDLYHIEGGNSLDYDLDQNLSHYQFWTVPEAATALLINTGLIGLAGLIIRSKRKRTCYR